MLNSQPTEKELLKAVLEPLLEDFQYWFGRSRSLLEKENLPFFQPSEQLSLLERVKTAQQEVSTAQLLYQTTGAGIEPSILVPWHQLVTECWGVASRWRSFKEKEREQNP